MSFSQEQKAETLLQPIKTETLLQPIKTSCCKKAMLQGILAAKAVVDEHTICISVDGSELINHSLCRKDALQHCFFTTACLYRLKKCLSLLFL